MRLARMMCLSFARGGNCRSIGGYRVAAAWILATIVALGGSTAGATPFLDIDFDSDTVGAQPTTGGPTNPITNLSAIGGYAPAHESPPSANAGEIVVGDADSISKGAVMTTNPGNGAIGALWLDTGFNVATQQLKLSFDLNILSAPTNATSQPIFLNTEDTTAGILLGMNAFTSPAGWAYRFAAAPTSENGGVFSFRTPDNSTLISFFDYTEGQTYHLEFDVDYSSGTLDAYVDGDLKLSNFAFWDSGVSNVTTSEFFFHLNGESGFANSVAIDNILAEAVPEPTSITLGCMSLIGAMGIAIRRRRNIEIASKC